MTTEPLNPKTHNRQNFDCEEPALIEYLQKRANKEHKNKISACFVAADQQGEILGYYTLSSSQISLEDVPPAYHNKVPRGYGVPVTLLGRIARHSNQKGTPTGRLLLMDALRRSYNASQEIGSMAVILDPKNPKLEEVYANYGFEKLDNGKMFLSMKAIAQLPGIQN